MATIIRMHHKVTASRATSIQWKRPLYLRLAAACIGVCVAITVIGLKFTRQGPHDWSEAQAMLQAKSWPELAYYMPPELDPCQNGTERCLISCSVYGSGNNYVEGALRLAKEAAHMYPGWKVRFYIGKTWNGSLIARIADHPHVELRRVDDWIYLEHKIGGMFPRFFAVHDTNYTRVIIRDTDSNLHFREVAAVREWIWSGMDYHTMHDNPKHYVPMLGGAWGVKTGVIPYDVIEGGVREGRYTKYMSYHGGDQDMLASAVWPWIDYKSQLINHNSYLCTSYFARMWRPFPTRSMGPRGHVGLAGESDMDEVLKASYRMLARELPLGMLCPMECRKEPYWLMC